MKNYKDQILDILASALVSLIFYIIDAWIGQWLWNDIIQFQVLFGWKTITFTQMFGLVWLSHILFSKKHSSHND